MLSNAYLLANFRFDTAENERKFADILPKTDNAAALTEDRAKAAEAEARSGGPDGGAQPSSRRRWACFTG